MFFVSGFFYPTPESMWNNFMFASMLLHLCAFFTGLQMRVTAEFTTYGAICAC